MNDFSKEISAKDIDSLCDLSITAGDAIMEIYNNDIFNYDVSYKSDNSPLTKADKISHLIIKNGLEKFTPDIPLLSEEGAQIPYEIRKKWKAYWCIDPLDGTKEFIKRNGEFTVNIALIIEGKPWLGIVYAPAKKILYYASKNTGAYKRRLNFPPDAIRCSQHEFNEWTAVTSRSHSNPDEILLLKRYPIYHNISIGSSLKFCLIAEGAAQVYCRLGPTMEWDTAAGHAIVEIAGGLMTDIQGVPITYNKVNLINPGFLCGMSNI